MSRIVAVAPQLSDAVLSAGGTLARHAAGEHDVVAVSVFGTPGGAADASAVAALRLAGAVHLAVDAADARGYADEHAKHDGLRPDDDAPRVAGAVLAVALAQLTPDLVLAPLGLSGHVDQLVVAAALDELGLPRLHWVDLPYALRRTPGAPLGAGEPVVVPIDDHLAAKLEAAALYDAELDRLAAYAADEGARAGLAGPVEILVRR